MKTQYSAMATFLAALSGLLFAIGIWFLLSHFPSVKPEFAVVIAAIIGGVEFLAVRYVLSQKFFKPRDDA
jgi:ABC-type branched-subunit amino acid transport system permease subunit